LILVAPTVVVDPDAVVARDVILVLDTSGSMAGEKMAQAKGAARYVIEHLNAEDRFNIVTFSTGVRSFAPAVVPASGSRADAIAFIDRLEALGGTNISMALLEALAQADADRPLTILFLTDGLATEGIVETPRLLEAVAMLPRTARACSPLASAMTSIRCYSAASPRTIVGRRPTCGPASRWTKLSVVSMRR
jgi:Ca-activated chloride channel homolog